MTDTTDQSIFLTDDDLLDDSLHECVVVRFFEADPLCSADDKQQKISKYVYEAVKQALRQLHPNAPHFKLDPVKYSMKSKLAYNMGLGFNGPAITVDCMRVRPSRDTWNNVLFNFDSVAAGIYRLLRWPDYFVDKHMRELRCDTLTYPEAMEPQKTTPPPSQEKPAPQKEPAQKPALPIRNSLILLEHFEGLSYDTQTTISLPPGEILRMKGGNTFFIRAYVPRIHHHIWIARKGEGSLWRQYTDEEEHTHNQLRELCKSHLKSVHAFMKTNRGLKRKLLNQEIHAAKDKRDLKRTKKKLAEIMRRLQQILA